MPEWKFKDGIRRATRKRFPRTGGFIGQTPASVFRVEHVIFSYQDGSPESTRPLSRTNPENFVVFPTDFGAGGSTNVNALFARVIAT